MEFFVGDHVEVAGVVVGPAMLRLSTWKKSPHPYNSAVSSKTQIVWVEAVILKKSTYAGAWQYIWEYRIAHPEDPDSQLMITHDMVQTNMRPMTQVIVEPVVPMANGCLHCKNIFTYPVEYNHKDGRLCYSCKSTYGWKYF